MTGGVGGRIVGGMEILKPLRRSDRAYFSILVRRHEPGGRSRSKLATLRPKTPQQEAMSPEDLLADVLAFMEERRW